MIPNEPEVYLGPCQIFMMGFFAQKKKLPSKNHQLFSQNPKGFLMFSGGIDKQHRAVMG